MFFKMNISIIVSVPSDQKHLWQKIRWAFSYLPINGAIGRCEVDRRDGGTSRRPGARLPAAGGKLACTLATSDASNGGALKTTKKQAPESLEKNKTLPGNQRMQKWDVQSDSGGYCFFLVLVALVLVFLVQVVIVLVFLSLLFLLFLLVILILVLLSLLRIGVLFLSFLFFFFVVVVVVFSCPATSKDRK